MSIWTATTLSVFASDSEISTVSPGCPLAEDSERVLSAKDNDEIKSIDINIKIFFILIVN